VRAAGALGDGSSRYGESCGFRDKRELRKLIGEKVPFTDDGRLTLAVTATYSSYPVMHEAVRAWIDDLKYI
jgi:hypothetical protein